MPRVLSPVRVSPLPSAAPRPSRRSASAARRWLTAALVAALTMPGLVAQTDDPYDGATSEKAQLKVFNKAYKGSDPQRLADALTAFGDASRRLEDGGASKSVARALAKGLDSDEVSVKTAALGAMAWGRHPDTVLKGVEELLDDIYNEIGKLVSRRDPESREQMQDVTALYDAGCQVLGFHKDDRAVDILAEQLAQATRGGQNNDNLAAHVVRPLSTALVELGSRDAIEAVVRKTGTFVGDRQTVHARKLHDALSTASDKIGRAPPAFSATYDQVWRDWFKEYEDKLPEKLGKLEGPIDEPPYMRRNNRGRMREDPNGPRRP